MNGDGRPTTDPEAAPTGALLPLGGYRGANMATGHLTLRADVLVALRRAGPATTASRQERTS